MNGGSDAEVAQEIIAEARAWRRHLHRHPELAYHERQTADFIAAKLHEFGLKVHRGLGGTGVVGTLNAGRSPRAIAIRADMDALPIEEQTGATHASCNAGAMHACGHDGHVTMALAAAKVCSRLADLDGTVHFIFQPAEEGEGGAQRMIQDGLFRLFPCDAIYALHNWPALPLGVCVARDGAMMAAIARFEITITGHGCHGAMPHEGVDPIAAGSHLVSALQAIVSRNVDPLQAAVVSVTQFNAGDTWNVIPGSCTLRGTVRWFDERIGDLLERRMTEMVPAISAAFDCQAEIRYERRFPATVNEPRVAAFVRAVANDLGTLVVQDARPSMGAEDFALMLQSVPGCYFWLGTGGKGARSLHSPHFDFNDELLPHGIALWTALVRASLRPAK